MSSFDNSELIYIQMSKASNVKSSKRLWDYLDFSDLFYSVNLEALFLIEAAC